MITVIVSLETGAILAEYVGSPFPRERWLNEFDQSLADPATVDHVEVPDCPGVRSDYDLDVVADPPVWVPNIPAMRARKLAEFETEGFSRVAAIHPPHHVSRLGLLPPGNPEVQAASTLITAIKLAVNDAEDAIDLITEHEELLAFEPNWPE